MANETNGGSGNVTMVNVLYRAALLAICGWALVATLDNGKSNVSIEKDVRYMKDEMSKFVTKDQLDLVSIRLHNEQLEFQVKLLTIPPQPTTKR